MEPRRESRAATLVPRVWIPPQTVGYGEIRFGTIPAPVRHRVSCTLWF